MKSKIYFIMLAVVFAAGILQTAMAQGGLWDRLTGPRNFDECILRNIPNATSSESRNAIFSSCRNLFSRMDELPNLVDVSNHFSSHINTARYITARNFRDGVDFGFTFNNQSENYAIQLFRIEFNQGNEKTILDCHPRSAIYPFQNIAVDCPFIFRAQLGEVGFKIVRIMGWRLR